MNTWREMLTETAAERGESFDSLTVKIAEGELDREFDSGFGGTEGVGFTAWGSDWVYFPICYDGAEWVGSAPRNPCDIVLEHQGGG